MYFNITNVIIKNIKKQVNITLKFCRIVIYINSKYMSLIVNQILEIIKRKGFTQESFAKKVDLTRFGLINGLKNETIKLKDLRKIADVLDINIKKLFDNINVEKAYMSDKAMQIIQEGGLNYNKVNSENNINTDSKFKLENKYLKDKIKSLEDQIENKNEIINLLKNQ